MPHRTTIDKRSEPIPRDGWGNKVSDVAFLVSLLDFYSDGQDWEPEDKAVMDRIKAEHKIK